MSGGLIQAVEISRDLRLTQRAVKGLYGVDWEAKKATVIPLIKAQMSLDGGSVLAAAHKLASYATDEGNPVFGSILLGTAVEMIDAGDGEEDRETRGRGDTERGEGL